VTLLGNDPSAAALSQALGTQYELVRLLGKGGMGMVYLAREPFLDRDVAVKVLPSDLASGDARERFLREARTAARLSHPNIVPLYTFGQAGDLLYYVMGYVDGESLETRLKREGALSFDETRRVTTELASALEYAHMQGVVHRDIKPDNVLLDRLSGRAMLTDFGVARHGATQDTLTQTGVIVGTPHYMSPEQASGERDVDGRSDIYSLGVVAYRMVTGRLPFEGTVLRDVLMQHATRAPIPPSQMVAGLPIDLGAAITRALAKDPGERWPSARAMRDALFPDSDEALPDELRAISGGGVRLGAISLALGQLALLGAIYGFVPRWEALMVVAVLTSAIGAASLIGPARRFGWRATLQAWFAQPMWWKTWWPRFGRRGGDVWDRLPTEIRSSRRLNGAVLLAAVPFFNFFLVAMRPSWLAAHPRFLLSGHMLWPSVAFLAAIYLPLAYSIVRINRWRRVHGLTKSDTQRMLSESTFSRHFWSRPHIAPLLGIDRAGQRGPQHPRDLVREIEAFAAAGAATEHADLYGEAAEAARGLATAIVRSDEELAQLSRDADPTEQTRIKTSLARTNEPEMRELLERQLQLLGELEQRQVDARARRERLVLQLRTLSLHLAALRAQSAMDSAAAAEITGRIHAICRGIDYRLEAARESRELLSS